ncbi:MAG: hypothetical protein GX194_14445 [Clostridium sp.]|nr:hypothetical protein [Clostridium sp.]
MRKTIMPIIIVILIFSLLPVPAYSLQEYTVILPFIFDQRITDISGDLVMTEDENGIYVYTAEGIPVKLEPYDMASLENGYIKIRPEGSRQWTVCRKDGSRVFEECYDDVIVTDQNIALVGIGDWRPPGNFFGQYGAIDLLTGEILISPSYSNLQMSADGKYIVDNAYLSVRVFDLNGNDVTDTVDYVAVRSYKNGYYGVRSTKTGLYGLVDSEGTLCVPLLYDQLGDLLSGALLVRKDGKWGVSSIDASGELLQPVEYTDARAFSGDIYALSKWDWITHAIDSNFITIHYGNGRQAFSAESYNAVNDVCGDVIYVSRRGDNAIVGLSKTGEVLVPPISDSYLSFSHDNFVLIQGKYDTSNMFPVSMAVNRWGEVIVPYGPYALLSDGSFIGKGFTLVNKETGQITRMMIDGYELRLPNMHSSVDYNRGWVIYNDNGSAWITDLYGNIIVPEGEYVMVSFSMNNPNLIAAGHQYIIAQDKNGKYGVLSLVEKPYHIPPHDWAVEDINEAISTGLVPENQQRDWRDSCIRGDFCRLLAPLLEIAGVQSQKQAAFTDTQDEDILLAASLGIVNGTGNGKFSPNQPISRQEAAVILSRTADVLGIKAEETPLTFKDEDKFADWARDGIYSVTSIICGNNEQRVMQGVSDGRFMPHGIYTREQAILTIFRMYRAYLLNQPGNSH